MNTEDDVFFTKKLDLMYNFCKYYMLICGQKPCVRKKKWIVTRMAYYIYTYKYRKPSIKSKRKLFTHPLLLVKHPPQKKKKNQGMLNFFWSFWNFLTGGWKISKVFLREGGLVFWVDLAYLEKLNYFGWGYLIWLTSN